MLVIILIAMCEVLCVHVERGRYKYRTDEMIHCKNFISCNWFQIFHDIYP